MAQTLAIDVGGTFVDIVVADESGIRVLKEPSSRADPALAVAAGLERLIRMGGITPASVDGVTHGTTVATNALLERTWAKTALVTTEGFRDVLEIGRQNRPSLYDLAADRPPPIVPRDLRVELRERVTASGEVEQDLDDAEIERLAVRLADERVEAVAVVFLFSYLAPEHERRAATLLATRLGVPVIASSDILPVIREVERTSTTVVAAALRPKVGAALQALENQGDALGLPRPWRVMQSNGAVATTSLAVRNPARLVLSGPAGGVEGVRWIGRAIGEPNLIGMDMGGTSCDVAVVTDGEAEWTSSASVGGYPVALPAVAVHSIGAGGGSVAWLDRGGALRVGPESAGAVPGPACYGRGGLAPTVTDAHLTLGRLDAERPLGSLGRLDRDAARRAIHDTLAVPLGTSVERASFGILEVADAAMERAIRVMTVERGRDPRDYTLVAFGGAGPLHAASMARRLGIRRVVIPGLAGVLSAFGLLIAETGHDESRSVMRRLGDLGGEELARRVREISELGRRALREEGVPEQAIAIRVSADVRYVGQAHEVHVDLAMGGRGADPAALRDAFDAAHERRFGHASRDRDAELVTLHVRASAPRPRCSAKRFPEPWPDNEKRSLDAWFDPSGSTPTAVCGRAALVAGDRVRGPLLLTGDDATVVLPPGIEAGVDEWGNLLLEVG